MYKARTKHTSPWNHLITVVLVLALAGAGASFYYYVKAKRNNAPSVVASTQFEEKINLDPPTQEEKQAAERQKQEAENRQKIEDQPSQAPSQKQAVTPVINDAGQYGGNIEVRAFIPNLYEAGGTCKLTLSKGNESVVKESAAIKEATTTRCAPFVVPRSELTSAGTWQALIVYLSASSEGQSDIRNIEVQ